MSCPEPQQEEFAHAHRIRWRDPGEEHFALSWEEVRQLDRRHVVGCHTLSHTRLSPGVERAAVLSEIVEGKRLLEERLGHEVESFAWVGARSRPTAGPPPRSCATPACGSCSRKRRRVRRALRGEVG